MRLVIVLSDARTALVVKEVWSSRRIPSVWYKTDTLAQLSQLWTKVVMYYFLKYRYIPR